MKKIITFIGIAAVILNTGCEKRHDANSEKEQQFVVTYPVRKDTTITREYVCQIHAIQHIEVRSMEKGFIENIYVDEGQLVEKGQHMFQIMPLIYQAELQRAEAEVDFERIEFQNIKSLADSNIVSENELALAKAKLDKAKAEYELAKTHYDFTDIRAPFSGLMNRFHVRLGSLVEEGELLTTLSDNSEMWVYFNVPEAEYLNLKTRKSEDSLLQVRLLMANNEVFDQVGIVETIEADFNNETGNIAFRATFANPTRLLRHGETGNILMDIPLKNTLLIPQKATFEVLDKKFVYVINEENIVEHREIVIGAEMPHLYEVKANLKENERILLEGLRKVRKGDEIKVETKDPKLVLSNLNLYAE